MSKMAKKISSNSCNMGDSVVWQQEAWPQMFLSTSVVGKVLEHNDMSPVQYFYRFIRKLLSEMPVPLAGSVFENKTRFVSKLAEFST